MNYIIGKITYIGSNYIILENSFIGYMINIPQSQNFEIDKYRKIFIYRKEIIHTNMLSSEWYGFETIKEKLMFEKLNKIPGIGPRISMSILSYGVERISNWITNQDYENLKLIKGLSQKLINLILQEIVIENQNPKLLVNKNIDDAVDALRMLGYNQKEINSSLNKIEKKWFIFDEKNDLSQLISSLIKNINAHETQ